ncbi:MAG: O-antigen ligase family protein, partial [Cyclobacteriaceae bacterium]
LQETASQSYRLFDLIGLVMFYLAVRIFFKKENHFLLLVLLIIGAMIQLVYGQLQLYGVYPSLHSGFPLTGSFFNPGPYSGYLAAVFPAALGIYLFVEKLLLLDEYKQLQSILKYFALATCGGILLVLPAAQSRAAWLAVLISAVFLLYHRYHWGNYLMGFIDRPVKKYIVAFLLAIVLIGLLGSMYLLKKDSADGRVLIWKASWEMIKENPWAGLGFDRFKAGYMEAQAAYFQANPKDPSIYLADDVVYTFNEGLQLLAEQGIIGLLLVFLLILFLFRIGKGKPCASLRISQAGIISIMVFGMFSYPSHILPIKLSAVFYFAIAAGESDLIYTRRIKRPNPLIAWGLSLFLLSLTAFAGVKLKGLYQASKDWKEALRLYNGGTNGTVIEKYQNAYPYFDKEGDFLTNYGKALSVQGGHKEAVITLERAKYYAGNTIIQRTLGDSYRALGLYKEAEEAYKLAVDMLPDRFYARYLLAKLYDETGEDDKLIPIARYLVEKEPKVPSNAVSEIKMEMEKVLEDKQNRTFNIY